MSAFVCFGNSLVVPYDGLLTIIERSNQRCTIIHQYSPLELDMSVKEAYRYLRKYELEELPLRSIHRTTAREDRLPSGQDPVEEEKTEKDLLPKVQDAAEEQTATGVIITSCPENEDT